MYRTLNSGFKPSTFKKATEQQGLISISTSGKDALASLHNCAGYTLLLDNGRLAVEGGLQAAVDGGGDWPVEQVLDLARDQAREAGVHRVDSSSHSARGQTTEVHVGCALELHGNNTVDVAHVEAHRGACNRGGSDQH